MLWAGRSRMVNTHIQAIKPLPATRYRPGSSLLRNRIHIYLEILCKTFPTHRAIFPRFPQ